MGTIRQGSLFSWRDVERSSEILRVKRVLDVLPDEELIEVLVRERKGRRDEYPLELVWNSIIAGVVCGHESVAALRRELGRNGELREVCGFEPTSGEGVVPPASVFSRFLAKLFRHAELIDRMFARLVDQVAALLKDFGVDLAVDGKALPTHGRKDPDAAWGMKTYKGKRKDGTTWEKVVKWFGYKLHLIVDAKYELPVAYEVTAANEADTTHLLPMIEQIEEDHPDLYERIETAAGDKGYDDGEDKAVLYDDHTIAPVIDTRDCFTNNGGDRWRPLDETRHDTIYYGPTGEVVCKVQPFAAEETERFAPMQFMGFEKDRKTLKFRCPAAAYGVDCQNRQACACAPTVRDGAYGRVVRVPLDRDRRLFMPIHRHSRRFRRLYKRRTSVERVNSRIDQVYGFERHFIRGHKKMRLRVGLALIVMLASAVAWVQAGQVDRVRSLLRAA